MFTCPPRYLDQPVAEELWKQRVDTECDQARDVHLAVVCAEDENTCVHSWFTRNGCNGAAATVRAPCRKGADPSIPVEQFGVHFSCGVRMVRRGGLGAPHESPIPVGIFELVV